MNVSVLARLAAVSLLGACAFGQTASAADLPVKAPVYAPPVDTWSPWEIRVRALGVLPQTGGSTVNVFTGNATTSAFLSSPNSGLSIGNSVVPELDITYYFTKNWAAELVLGVTPHTVSTTGNLAGLTVGKTWLLPPTLTLQYHFDNFGAFQPYLGVGVNYTWFFNTTASGALGTGYNTTGLWTSQFSVKSAPGVALQAGFDYMIDRHWGLNVDVKKLWLEPNYTATVNNAIPVNGRANINPWLVGGGIAYKF